MKLLVEAASSTDKGYPSVNASALTLTVTGPAPFPTAETVLEPIQISEPKQQGSSIPRRTKGPKPRARHLIRPVQILRLPVRPLQEQVRWWLRRHPERTAETWVLQTSLRGPVWRHERWADWHKDIFAIAILEPWSERKVE
jgi:hypothetical protein